MNLDQLIESYREDIIRSVQELVRIRSVEGDKEVGMPFGKGVNEALIYTLDLCNRLGFKTENLEGYAGHGEIGKGEKTVGVLAHLDVVPAGDGWDFDPFGAEIHEGRIYGRGTMDDKGPAVAALYAMKAVVESGMPIKNNIRIIFGTNEENRWEGIKYYLKKMKAPDIGFTPDADFPVIHGEKGISDIILRKKFSGSCKGDIVIKSVTGGNRPNMVPDRATATLKVVSEKKEEITKLFKEFVDSTGYDMSMHVEDEDVVVESKGISAHGSTPEAGKNAISQLVKFLGSLELSDCETSRFVKLYYDKIGMECNGQSIGCGLEDDISGKLSFNVGIIKINEGEGEIVVNIRYPIKYKSRELYDGIMEELQGSGVELIEDDHLAPIYVPQDHFLVEKLMNVYRELTGDNDSEPIVIGGGTYARAMKNAVAFGPLLPGQEDLAHQKNEYISIEHLMKITEIYARALYELAKE